MEGWNTMCPGMPNSTPMEVEKSQEVVNSQKKLIIVEEIFLDIGKQMLETSYTLSLGQLLEITPELKKYLQQKLKPQKTKNVNITTTQKQVGSSVLEVGTTVVVIVNHMVVVQVQIGKNMIKDVLLDGGFKINIFTE